MTAQDVLYGLKTSEGERDSTINHKMKKRKHRYNNLLKPSQVNTNTTAPTKPQTCVLLMLKSSRTCDFYYTNNE